MLVSCPPIAALIITNSKKNNMKGLNNVGATLSDEESTALVVISRPEGSFLVESSAGEDVADQLDDFNRPRMRRDLILSALQTKAKQSTTKMSNGTSCRFVTPLEPAFDLLAYRCVHSERLVEFVSRAWTQWVELRDGRDPMCFAEGSTETEQGGPPPPLVPANAALPRDAHQQPSANVMGGMGFYCTDTCTPIVSSLVTELRWDAAISRNTNIQKVAILDVDYHCGNGTASIFYEDPSVLVVSLHCDPDVEYPFHSGFASQQGFGEGVGTTLHLPLPPGTTWNEGYQQALTRAMEAIMEFGAHALVVSLGVDTHLDDPVVLRGAGFRLEGTDYWNMGETMASSLTNRIPTVIVQEGGYKMDVVAEAVSNVVLGYALYTN
eukprot:scaffold104840_cov53-Attheya_sp.AAC.5